MAGRGDIQTNKIKTPILIYIYIYVCISPSYFLREFSCLMLCNCLNAIALMALVLQSVVSILKEAPRIDMGR